MIFDWDQDEDAPPLAARVVTEADGPQAAIEAARPQAVEHMKAVALAMGLSTPAPVNYEGLPMRLQPLAVFAGHLQEASPTTPCPTREYTVVTASSDGAMFTDYVIADSPLLAVDAADHYHPVVFTFPGHHVELLHHRQVGWHPAGTGTGSSGGKQPVAVVTPQDARADGMCACGCPAAEHVAANQTARAALSCGCEHQVPGTCPALELVLRLFEILDGPEEWDSDHIEYIANEFQRWGFYIRDPSEHPDPADELAAA